MANTVKVKLLSKGPRNIVAVVFLRNDGVSGELNKATLIDPVADLGLTSKARLALDSVLYNLAGFDAIIEFGSGQVEDNWKWALVEGSNAPADFAPFGGLVDDSGVDGTGKLRITTVGFTSSQDFGSILLKLRLRNG